MLAPTVAAITLHSSGGGIAAVSQLLWRVFESQWERARLVTMFNHDSRPASLVEKARFTSALTRAQLLGQTDWVLFSHLALAQVQHAIPGRLRCGYGVFLHGIEAWKPLSGRELQVLAEADVRLANSTYTANRVMQMYPSIGRVEPCPLALLPDQSSPADRVPAAALPPLGPHAVLVVGRMLASERYKGHDQLIAAWPAVLARVPDAQLVIAGTGDDQHRLAAKAAAVGCADRILFVGFLGRSVLHALYDRAALFALPSRGEGFGLVYLEAMSHRLACVASVHDAGQEVVRDGITGRLVNQADADGIADVISSLLLDDALRRRMGEAGRERLCAQFNFEQFRHRVSDALVGVDAVAATAIV